MTEALQKVTREVKAMSADKYDVSAQGEHWDYKMQDLVPMVELHVLKVTSWLFLKITLCTWAKCVIQYLKSSYWKYLTGYEAA